MKDNESSIVPLEALRNRLGKMTDRIIFRLQDRSGYPLNSPVYQLGAVPIIHRGSEVSFLEFAIEGLETYHASLGRYEYPDQHPIIISKVPATMARRIVGIPTLPNVEINLRDRLVPFYRDIILPKLCKPDDDPDTYGETVFLDADVLELLNERINVGRYVASTKAKTDPSIWDIVSNTDELIKKLKDPSQEDRVINSTRSAAEKYGLKPDIAELVFRWVIVQTIDVEVAYLQGAPRPNINNL